MLNKYLDVAPEVQEALDAGKPVVALESTIISHGMPYPKNVETAMLVEKTIRENGAVPATIAVIGGRLKAGLTYEEIEHLGKAGHNVAKASRRDLPALVARGVDGATTVTTTMIIAHMAGIKIFATGGIGGVHRGAETTMDISADLEELAQTPVMVVCAGAKSILDLGLTLEYLETKGVPVIGYGTGELPAFYTRKSGFSVDYRVDSPEELAEMFRAQRGLEFKGGMLVTNPIPEEYSMDKEVIDKAIDQALAECKEQGVHGKETTPFLLARVVELTGGDSLESNIQLVLNNARLAARTACALAKYTSSQMKMTVGLILRSFFQLSGAHAEALAEGAVKRGIVRESAVGCCLGCGSALADEPRRVHQPLLPHVCVHGHAGLRLKKPHKVILAQKNALGQNINAQLST